MAKERLIGDDGYVCFGELETALVGDGTDDLDDLVGDGVGSGEGFYQVASIATSGSVFDWTSPAVGDYFWNDGTLVMTVGDTARRLPYTEAGSIRNFEINPSRARIDVSTFADNNRTYRMGKADMTGSMGGIFSINSDTWKLTDRFVDRMTVAANGDFTVSRIDDDPIYFVGFLQGEKADGETLVAIVGKVELENFRFGATDGQAQEFTANMAPASGDNMMLVTVAWPQTT